MNLSIIGYSYFRKFDQELSDESDKIIKIPKTFEENSYVLDEIEDIIPLSKVYNTINSSKKESNKFFSTPKNKASSDENLSLSSSDNDSSCNFADEHKEFTPCFLRSS